MDASPTSSAFLSPREAPNWIKAEEFTAEKLGRMTPEEYTSRVPSSLSPHCDLMTIWNKFGAEHNPWAHQLSYYGLNQPNRIAFEWLDGDGNTSEVYTYSDLLVRSSLIASYMTNELGLTVQSRVVLCYPPCLEFVPAFFACLLTGIVAIPVYPPDPTKAAFDCQRFLSICEAGNVKNVLTNSLYYKVATVLPALHRSAKWRQLKWHNTTSYLTRRIRSKPKDHQADFLIEPIPLKPSYTAFLQFTSGSTGNPKGVMVSIGGLIHNCHLCISTFGFNAQLDNPNIVSSIDSVPFTQFERWLHEFRQPIHLQSVGHECRVLSWLPVYHDMGLIGFVCTPTLFGGCVIQMSPIEFIRKPWSWLLHMSRLHAMCSAAPNFAFELSIRKMPQDVYDQLDLSRIAGLLCGAEPIRRRTMVEFLKKFVPKGLNPNAIKPAYGLAENTLIATGPRSWNVFVKCVILDSTILRTHGLAREPILDEDVTEADPALRPLPKSLVITTEEWQGRSISALEERGCTTLIACGERMSGVEVIIANPESCREVPTGTVGEIWIKSPSLAKGYYGNEVETNRAFNNSCESLSGKKISGMFRTGDAGFILEKELYCVGRIKDMLIIRGCNYFPQDIEHVVEELPHIRDGCSAVFGIEIDGEEKCAIAVEVREAYFKSKAGIGATITSVFKGKQYDEKSVEALAQNVKKVVSNNMGLEIAAIWVCRAGALPKTSSGKLRRTVIRERLLAKDPAILCNVLYHSGPSHLAVSPTQTRSMKDSPITNTVAPFAEATTSAFETEDAAESEIATPIVTPEPKDLDDFFASTNRKAQILEEIRALWGRLMSEPWKKENLTTPVLDLGLDSITAVQMMSELSSRTGITLEPQVLFEHPTLERIIDYIIEEMMPKPSESVSNCTPVDVLALGVALPNHRTTLSFIETVVSGNCLIGQLDPALAKDFSPEMALVLRGSFFGHEERKSPSSLIRRAVDEAFCMYKLQNELPISAYQLIQIEEEDSQLDGDCLDPKWGQLSRHVIAKSAVDAFELAANSSIPSVVLACHIVDLNYILKAYSTHGFHFDDPCASVLSRADGQVLGEGIAAVILSPAVNSRYSPLATVRSWKKQLIQNDDAIGAYREVHMTACKMACVKPKAIELIEMGMSGDKETDLPEITGVVELYGKRQFDKPVRLSTVASQLGFTSYGTQSLLQLAKAVVDVYPASHIWLKTADGMAECDVESRFPESHIHPSLTKALPASVYIMQDQHYGNQFVALSCLEASKDELVACSAAIIHKRPGSCSKIYIVENEEAVPSHRCPDKIAALASKLGDILVLPLRDELLSVLKTSLVFYNQQTMLNPVMLLPVLGQLAGCAAFSKVSLSMWPNGDFLSGCKLPAVEIQKSATEMIVSLNSTELVRAQVATRNDCRNQEFDPEFMDEGSSLKVGGMRLFGVRRSDHAISAKCDECSLYQAPDVINYLCSALANEPPNEDRKPVISSIDYIMWETASYPELEFHVKQSGDLYSGSIWSHSRLVCEFGGLALSYVDLPLSPFAWYNINGATVNYLPYRKPNKDEILVKCIGGELAMTVNSSPSLVRLSDTAYLERMRDLPFVVQKFQQIQEIEEDNVKHPGCDKGFLAQSSCCYIDLKHPASMVLCCLYLLCSGVPALVVSQEDSVHIRGVHTMRRQAAIDRADWIITDSAIQADALKKVCYVHFDGRPDESAACIPAPSVTIKFANSCLIDLLDCQAIFDSEAVNGVINVCPRRCRQVDCYDQMMEKAFAQPSLTSPCKPMTLLDERMRIVTGRDLIKTLHSNCGKLELNMSYVISPYFTLYTNGSVYSIYDYSMRDVGTAQALCGEPVIPDFSVLTVNPKRQLLHYLHDLSSDSFSENISDYFTDKQGGRVYTSPTRIAAGLTDPEELLDIAKSFASTCIPEHIKYMGLSSAVKYAYGKIVSPSRLEVVCLDPEFELCGLMLITLAASSPIPPSLQAPDVTMSEIAFGITGIGIRMPGGAQSVSELHDFVMDGKSSVKPITRYALAPSVYARAASLFDTEHIMFDSAHFHISTAEASAMDPNHRMVLTVTASALLDAGKSKSLANQRIGVFVGHTLQDWAFCGPSTFSKINTYTALGKSQAMNANRVSYHYGFTGPSLTIDTACSSSLVALDSALQCMNEDSGVSACIVASSNIILSALSTQAVCATRLLSPDGCCKTFDMSADGYGRGEAGIALILERVNVTADKDKYYATVLGTAVNHGGLAASLTAPNTKAQKACLMAAFKKSKIASIEAIKMYEAHGTGTSLGDPLEISCLEAAYGTNRKSQLMVTAAKSNFNHCEAAAGLVGVVSTIGYLTHQRVPQLIHLKTLNPRIRCPEEIDFPRLPRKLTHKSEYAGISSFGFGGTNSHVLIGRGGKLTAKLPEVGLLFTGQGAHYAAMGRMIYKESSEFRARADEVIAMYPTEKLRKQIVSCFTDERAEAADLDVDIQQIQTIVLQLALYQFVMDMGVSVNCVIGHSAGEVAAATCAGILSLEEAVELSIERSRLLQTHVPKDGAMCAVFTSLPYVQKNMKSEFVGLSVAAENAPDSVVISGPTATIEQFLSQFSPSVEHRYLKVNRAFHSPAVERSAAELEVVCNRLFEKSEESRLLTRELKYRDNGISFISTATGKRVVAKEEVRTGEYWCRQMLTSVKFRSAVTEGAKLTTNFLECGPRCILATLAPKSAPQVEAKCLLGPKTKMTDTYNALQPYTSRKLPIWEYVTYPYVDLTEFSGRPAEGSSSAENVVITDELVCAFAEELNLSICREDWRSTKLNQMLTDVDSLMISEITCRLVNDFNLNIPLSAFLEYDTLGELLESTVQPPPVISVIPPPTSVVNSSDCIRVVGVGIRLPETTNSLAEMIGREAAEDVFKPIGYERFNPWLNYKGVDYLHTGQVVAATLKDPGVNFPSSAFRLGNGEAKTLDPQQRLLLLTARDAIHHAGFCTETMPGNTAVYIGCSDFEWPMLVISQPQTPSVHTFLGAANCMAANRISFAYGLTGTSMTIDTGCSSGSSAIIAATKELKSGYCDLAIAGAVSLILTPLTTMGFAQMRYLSRSTSIAPFDAQAAGTIRGEGAICLLLAREASDDATLLKISGAFTRSSSNSLALGFFHAPSQATCIASALANAGVTSNDIDFVETHGMGIMEADQVEMSCLRKVFGEQPIGISASHPIYGHSNALLGLTQVCRVIVQLHQGQCYPVKNWTKWPVLSYEPKFIATGMELKKRRAVASTFGMGGTSCALVLEGLGTLSDSLLQEPSCDGCASKFKEESLPWSTPDFHLAALQVYGQISSDLETGIASFPSKETDSAILIVCPYYSDVIPKLFRALQCTAEVFCVTGAHNLLNHPDLDAAVYQTHLCYLDESHFDDLSELAKALRAVSLNGLPQQVILMNTADGSDQSLMHKACIDAFPDVPSKWMYSSPKLFSKAAASTESKGWHNIDCGYTIDDVNTPLIFALLSMMAMAEGVVPDHLIVPVTMTEWIVEHILLSLRSNPQHILKRVAYDSACLSRDVGLYLCAELGTVDILSESAPVSPLITALQYLRSHWQTDLDISTALNTCLRLPLSQIGFNSLLRKLNLSIPKLRVRRLSGQTLPTTFIAESLKRWNFSRRSLSGPAEEIVTYYLARLHNEPLSPAGYAALLSYIDQLVIVWAHLENNANHPERVPLELYTTADRTAWKTEFSKKSQCKAPGDESPTEATASVCQRVRLTFGETVNPPFDHAMFEFRAADILSALLCDVGVPGYFFPTSADEYWEDTILLESLGLSDNLAVKFGWGMDHVDWVKSMIIKADGFKWFHLLVTLLVRRRVGLDVSEPVIYTGISAFYKVYADLIRSQIPEAEIVYLTSDLSPVKLIEQWKRCAAAFQMYTRAHRHVRCIERLVHRLVLNN